jgi:hypothetical protein
MKSFNELESLNLKWVQTSAWNTRNHELRDENGDVMATMRQPSLWRSQVEIEAVGNRWTFERKGFWRYHVEIRSTGTDEQPARFTYRDRMLEFPDGRVYYWKQSSFWGSKWVWTDAQGTPILGFQSQGTFRYSSDIALDEEVASMKSLPMLVFLGWYLILMYYADSSSAAVVAATS